MSSRSVIPLILVVVCVCASPAQADPISFNIGTCTSGDCSSYAQSGGGSILAELDIVNGNDLLITLTNALNRSAVNDDPFLTALGFQYDGDMGSLTFDRFTPLSGNVAPPLFSVNATIRSFFLDFGFGFSLSHDGRFQAIDPHEVVQILVGTTGDISLHHFQMGVAKIAGTGENGSGGSAVLTGGPTTTSVPEPGSLAMMAVGLGTVAASRKWRARR